MKRESGYYWVKLRGQDRDIVAEWDADLEDWWIAGNEVAFYDSDFDQIDERKIVRQ